MARKILVADLLCGAGGSSTGCQRALAEMGLEMELVCVNHWGVAIETHKKNHPEARHYVQDISTVRPHLIVPEGYLDLLMASPTCTHHSVARGGKPTSDQQRSDPWHIVTWLTELRVRRVIIENVWEFIGWGPVDHRTGKPIKSRKGEYFHAWIETIRRLGFEPEWRKLNAADFGDATTRQRFILMARSDGKTVHWPTPTHGRKPNDGLSLFPGVKPWKPAREIIDWQIKGRSILNRKKPLAPKTLARIYAGAVKFRWPEPFLVVLRNHMGAQSVEGPIPTLAANGNHVALAEPVVMPFVMATGSSGAPRSAEDPMPTITTGGAGSERQGCARPMLIEPLIAPYYGDGSGKTCGSTGQPLPTVTSKARLGMVVPVTHSQGHNKARDVAEPVPTMTTAKGGEFALVMPVTHAGGIDRAQDDTAPLPTVTGANRGELAFVTAQFGEREGQAPRVHDLALPAPVGMTLGNGLLIEGTQGFDILFRMLEPHELAAAMGFTSEEATYEFAGTKTEQIKQIGNAVSVSKMKACVGSIMADAAPKKTTVDPMQIAAE